jgi:hypothetical protein
MKIVKWLSDRFSNKLGNALVEVEENEVSDVEEMLKLIDGDSVGHFGISVKLVGCPDMPKYEMGKGGMLFTQGQFGYDRASIMKNKKRYYEVLVSRD